MLFFTAVLAASLAQAFPAHDLTLPPETASIVTILEGRGVQIYTCSAQGGSQNSSEGSNYAWTLTAPEAQLFNLATGKPQGHHSAGPTWTLDDGSALHGTVVQRKSAENPGDVPWLLLQAEPAGGTQGTLTPVSYVRRYNTHGGAAPATGCTSGQAGQTTRVPYSAMYGFYAIPR